MRSKLSKKEKQELERFLSDDFVGWCPDFWELAGKDMGLKGKALKKFCKKA